MILVNDVTDQLTKNVHYDTLYCIVNRVQHTPVVKPLEKDQPSVEQILAHLDHMRSACKDISCM